jgi:hypothetical protein
VILVGLVVVFVGIHELTTVECGGRQMTNGDSCVNLGSGGTRDFEQQHRFNEGFGSVAIGVGVALLLGAGVYLLRTRELPPHTYHDRQELARREGWDFQASDTGLLKEWQPLSAHLASTEDLRGVIRGTLDGLRFAVFDYSAYDGENTAWVVYLPEPAPPGFRNWCKGRRLRRRPLNLLQSTPNALINYGVRQHRSRRPDNVLRQVRALATIVRRFERDRAGRDAAG